MRARSRPPRPAAPLLALGAVLAVLGAVLGGCGDTLQVQPISHNQLEGLVVAPFRVYWLGYRFKGLTVSSVSHDPGEAYSVRYGNCLTGGQGNCQPPLLVVSSPANGFLPGGSARTRQTHVRGVPALEAQSGRVFVVRAGNVVIDVYASNGRLARTAARNLVAINAPGSAQDPLPPATGTSTFESAPLRSQVPSPLRRLR